jgi:hypothetical protein
MLVIVGAPKRKMAACLRAGIFPVMVNGRAILNTNKDAI